MEEPKWKKTKLLVSALVTAAVVFVGIGRHNKNKNWVKRNRKLAISKSSVMSRWIWKWKLPASRI